MSVRQRNATWLAMAALAVAMLSFATSEPGGGPTRRDSIVSHGRDSVVRVVDGDTVVLRSAGKSRLIGVDTPEVFGRPGCFGQEASEFAKRTLQPGMPVRVERDAEPRDRYGRSLIYLTLPDGRSFNELLVDEGFAVPLAIPPNTRYAERFRELSKRARGVKAGLWSPSTCGDDRSSSRRNRRPRTETGR